jgi:ABC-2 type transport system permease protein
MLRFLLEKEFKQMVRNPLIPRIIIILPVIMLLILPWAANQEIKDMKLSVVDHDHSTLSRRLQDKATSSGYFTLADVSASNEAAMNAIDEGRADVIMEIPAHFERDLVSGGGASVMLSVNAVNGVKGSLGSSYLATITGSFTRELLAEQGLTVNEERTPRVEILSSYRFNPYLDYKNYMVPAIMVMLLTIFTGFLPSANIVNEKEIGTMEQMNVTPVGKLVFVLSKVLPYWVVGFVVLTVGICVAALVYGQYPVGSLLTIYLYAAVYVLGISGLGITIANRSSTLQQTIFMNFFFIIIFIMLSGLLTPIQSMPEWAQAITYVNPLRYFVDVMRAIFLKGSTMSDLLPQFYAICGFAVFFNILAVLSYRKSV